MAGASPIPRLPPGLFPFRTRRNAHDPPVHLFQIDRDARPTDRAEPAGSFDVTADTVDGARAAALAQLKAEGRTVRSLSLLADGGLAAVVTQPAPAPTAAQVRRARGAQ